MRERGGWRACHEFAVRIQEPVHEAVSRLDRCWGERHPHPFFGEDLLILPFPPAQRQIAEARLVAGADEHPSSPVSPAADRLNLRAIYHHPGVLVTIPAPGLRGVDRIHAVFLERLRQWATPDVERRERQDVHPDVVVLVYRARLIPFAAQPFGRVIARAVGPIRLAPQRTLPVTGLPKQMLPGDLPIMFGLETLQQLGFSKTLCAALSEIRRERYHGRHIVMHAV